MASSPGSGRVLMNAEERLSGDSRPFLERTRKVQYGKNGPLLNLSEEGADLLELQQSTEMQLVIFSDGIWIQRADEDRED
jgi:hypothetical protein